MNVKSIIATSILAVGTGAMAAPLPSFTLDPSGVGLSGSSFTANSVQLSDYATVWLPGDGTFTETGFMAVTSFQLDGQPVVAPGLNTGGYGLYVEFSGAGTFSTPYTGTFSSLTYTLYGYNGAPIQFGFDGSHNPVMVTPPASTIKLASGSLVPGTGSIITTPAPQFAFASMSLDFSVDSTNKAFFASPNPFYMLADATFSNTPQQINTFAGGVQLNQGGGVMTMVPEPETYAMMLAGLGTLGFLIRRRQRRDD